MPDTQEAGHHIQWPHDQLDLVRVCFDRTCGRLTPLVTSCLERHLLTFYINQPLGVILPRPILLSFWNVHWMNFLNGKQIRCDVEAFDDSAPKRIMFSGRVYGKTNGGNFEAVPKTGYAVTLLDGKTATIVFEQL